MDGRGALDVGLAVVTRVSLNWSPSREYEQRAACVALELVLNRSLTDDQLTPREVEVLRLVALGHTSVEIASKLHLSPRTVESHRARIHNRLGVATRAELVRYALRLGLLRI